MHIDIGSALRGIRAIQKPYVDPVPRWAVMWLWPWGFWAELWTPRWHEGRGPYVTIGLGLLAVYRGY